MSSKPPPAIIRWPTGMPVIIVQFCSTAVYSSLKPIEDAENQRCCEIVEHRYLGIAESIFSGKYCQPPIPTRNASAYDQFDTVSNCLK